VPAAAAPAWPEALRVADIGAVLMSHGLEVIDRGNLAARQPVAAADRWLPPLHEVVAWNEAVHAAVYAELADRRMPILLAATIAGLGSISAVARHCREAGKKLRVLWLDAHADFNTNATHAERQHHGHAGRLLCGLRPEGVDRDRRHRAGDQPEDDPQIGIRSVDQAKKRLVTRRARGLRHALIDEMGMRSHDGAGARHHRTPTRICK